MFNQDQTVNGSGGNGYAGSALTDSEFEILSAAAHYMPVLVRHGLSGVSALAAAFCHHRAVHNHKEKENTMNHPTTEDRIAADDDWAFEFNRNLSNLAAHLGQALAFMDLARRDLTAIDRSDSELDDILSSDRAGDLRAWIEEAARANRAALSAAQEAAGTAL